MTFSEKFNEENDQLHIVDMHNNGTTKTLVIVIDSIKNARIITAEQEAKINTDGNYNSVMSILDDMVAEIFDVE
jgi:hypothetical protein